MQSQVTETVGLAKEAAQRHSSEVDRCLTEVKGLLKGSAQHQNQSQDAAAKVSQPVNSTCIVRYSMCIK